MQAEWEVFFDKCMRRIAKVKVVLDVGGGQPFQKEMRRYKELFKPSHYFSLDLDATCCPDIVGDACNLPIKNESIDAIICKSLLEHLPEPWKAIDEIYRVLKSGGMIFLYVPFLFPYHGGLYKDYYRFTADALEHLFRRFKKVQVVKVKGFAGVLALIVLPDKFPRWLSPITDLSDKFLKRNITSGYYLMAIK